VDRKRIHGPTDRKRFITFWFVRILLLLLLIFELLSNRPPFQYFYFIVFLLSFIPSALKRVLSISLPLPFELLYLISLLFMLIGEKIFAGIMVQFVLGVFFGIFGFLLMYILYFNSRLESSKILITLFSFSFAVAAGAIWQVFLFLLNLIITVQTDTIHISYAPIGLLFTICGASTVAIGEYFYLTYGEGKILHRLLKSFMKKNPTLFIKNDTTPDQIKQIIKQGENEQIEFKSSLRTNIHTKKPDKKMEHSVLKTITAFLNTDGGTLLIGVADNGEIIGIEHDGFTKNDKFYQHYTNLIQNHIGNEYLPLIKSRLVQIENKTILKIDCRQSDKEVFFSKDNDQYFYVRIGPASVKLTGKKLIDYVHKKF